MTETEKTSSPLAVAKQRHRIELAIIRQLEKLPIEQAHEVVTTVQKHLAAANGYQPTKD